jgi:pentatricopeptide repeat protein
MSIFNKGQVSSRSTCFVHPQAAEELARGQQQGWAANSQVYEAMVTAVCEAGHLSEAIEIVNRMKVLHCVPATAPLIHCFALSVTI